MTFFKNSDIIIIENEKEVVKIGYYTYFRCTIESGVDGKDITREVAAEVSKRFAEISTDANYIDEDWFNDYVLDPYDTVKWYDYEVDMKALSAAFSDYVFYLEGQGEERDDWWRQVFHKGHTSQQNMVEPPIWPDIP